MWEKQVASQKPPISPQLEAGAKPEAPAPQERQEQGLSEGHSPGVVFFPPSFLCRKILGVNRSVSLALIPAAAPLLFMLLKYNSRHTESVVFMKYSPVPRVFIDQCSK